MPGNVDLRQIPKWQKELVENTLKMNEGNRTGKRGRPSFLKFEEGYMTLYMMKYVWGMSISKIHEYLNEVAREFFQFYLRSTICSDCYVKANVKSFNSI